jgi:hypothetical protein
MTLDVYGKECIECGSLVLTSKDEVPRCVIHRNLDVGDKVWYYGQETEVLAIVIPGVKYKIRGLGGGMNAWASDLTKRDRKETR